MAMTIITHLVVNTDGKVEISASRTNAGGKYEEIDPLVAVELIDRIAELTGATGLPATLRQEITNAAAHVRDAIPRRIEALSRESTRSVRLIEVAQSLAAEAALDA